MEPRRVLCIVGPTACGKTGLAVRIAKQLDGEIISADAVAVYKRLDIGSAKPTVQEREGVPHHLIDCVELSDNAFSVSEFRTMARSAIDDVLNRNKVPIVVGGSGLYVDSIFSDMRFSAPSDPEIRAALEREYDSNANGVFDALRRVDPVTAARLHMNDKKRVVRAMEVFYVSGKPYSALNESFETAQNNDDTYHVVRIGLNMPREELYRRIGIRVDRMIENGLVDEAFALYDEGYTPERNKAMLSIGYAQLYPVFCGECSLESAIDRIKQDTRRFAKRQITWFKRNRDIIWFDVNGSTVHELAKQISELLK